MGEGVGGATEKSTPNIQAKGSHNLHLHMYEIANVIKLGHLLKLPS